MPILHVHVFAIYILVPSYYTLIDLSSCCFLKPLDLKIYVHMRIWPCVQPVKLMIQAYVGDGSRFHTQVAIYEQGYSNTLTFALALYRDGTAAGYLRYPYIVITGPSVPASAAGINTP